jgi:hypothetical protein
MATEQTDQQTPEEQTSPHPDQSDGPRNGSQEDADRNVVALDRSDESQEFVDKSKIDFDPDEGVYSGTAVDGTSEIPGPHLDGDSGELSEEDLKREAQKQTDENGVDPAETPAAKSPVAKAAEQERADNEGAGETKDADDE